MTFQADSLRSEFERLLNHARHHLFVAGLVNTSARAVHRALCLLFIGSLTVLAVAVLAWIFRSAINPFYLIAALAILVAVVVIWPLVRAMGSRPTLRETAERLDLAVLGQNKIATALEFIEQKNVGESIFVQAAIASGLTALRENSQAQPAVSSGFGIKRAVILRGLLGLVILAVSFLPLKFPFAAKNSGVGANAGAAAAADKTESPAAPKVPMQARNLSTRNASDRDVEKSSQVSSSLNESIPPAARPNMKPAQAGTSHASSGAGGSSSSGLSTGKSPDQRQAELPTAAQKNSRSKESPSQNADQQENDQSASLSRLGAARAGGGSAVSVPSSIRAPFSQIDTMIDDLDGLVSVVEKPTDTQNQGSQQPLLQDRRQAPTRELNISSGKGGGGNGRGGPTPAKKSRGTGTLLFSVPTPDYIPAPLRPGPSRVQYESSPSVPMAGKLNAPVEAATRTTDETPQSQFDPGIQESHAAWRYFEILHRQDQTDGQTQTTSQTGAVP